MYDKEFINISRNSNRNDLYGFMLDTIPKDLYEALLSDAHKIKNNFDNQLNVQESLAGHLAHEYDLKVSQELRDYMDDLIKYYEVKSGNFVKNYFGTMPILKQNPPSRIDKIDGTAKKFKLRTDWVPDMDLYGLWINFQQKYEYNPMHNHSGVLSFVIWLDIPYTMEEELDFAHKRGIHPQAALGVGSFNFTFPGLNECANYQIHADKSYNGVICLFPSKLQHSVNPFYSSDDYRITLAGNIAFANFEENIKNFIGQKNVS